MFIYIFSVLLLLLLISQSIILLNEEFLILLCFSTFCWLAVKNMSSSISNDLDSRGNKIEVEIRYSLTNVLNSLKKMLEFKDKSLNLFQIFKLLGLKCLKLSNAVTNWLVTYTTNSNKSPFPKKLQFIVRFEKQMMRLLTLLIIYKLRKIIKIKYFYSNILFIPQFKCTDKVAMLEYIQAVTKNK